MFSQNETISLRLCVALGVQVPQSSKVICAEQRPSLSPEMATNEKFSTGTQNNKQSINQSSPATPGGYKTPMLHHEDDKTLRRQRVLSSDARRV